jgi:UDP-glucose 4-epimerase
MNSILHKIGIIGASGFIGSSLVEPLLSNGHELVLYGKELNLDLVGLNNVIQVQVNGKENIDIKYFQDCDCIFYLIGGDYKSKISYAPQFEKNVLLFEQFLSDLILLSKLPKIYLFSSAGTIYGSSENLVNERTMINPFGSYGLVKFVLESILENYANTYGFDYLILRITNPYGIKQIKTKSNGLIVNLLNNYFQNTEGHLPNDLSIYRDYIFIDDLVSIISILLDKPINGTLNLSSGISYSIENIIEVIKNNGIDLVNINYNYSKPGLRYNYVSNKKLLDLIGNYDFVSLEDGIKRIIATFKIMYK